MTGQNSMDVQVDLAEVWARQSRDGRLAVVGRRVKQPGLSPSLAFSRFHAV